MKRLFVLLLLVLMPLQLVWAAAGVCCEPDQQASTQHVCHQLAQQCDDDDGAPGDDGGCDCCHHLAASALLAAPPTSLLPVRLPVPRADPPHYTSHIPDLIPPPDWPSRR